MKLGFFTMPIHPIEKDWRLSLKEWRMLTAGPVQAAPLGRGELERMQEMWPDD